MLPTKAEMLTIIAREQHVKQKRNPPKKHRLSRIYTRKFSLDEEKPVKEGVATVIHHFRVYKTLTFKGDMGFIFTKN